MPFVRNVGPKKMSLVYGGFSVPLEPGETKRLKPFRHPTTGDIYDPDHMASTFRQRYPDCGLQVFDDEQIDSITDEQLEELTKEDQEKLIERLQGFIDQFNENNMVQAQEGLPTMRPPKSLREVERMLKGLRKGDMGGAFVSDERLDEARTKAPEAQKNMIDQLRVMAQGGDLEAIKRILDMSPKEGATPLDPGGVSGELVTPAPARSGRRRGMKGRGRSGGSN